MTHTRQNFRCIKGCCICGTKSSTSRFTSSNNYQAYFATCFLVKDRTGEICNACVLIVKRFMKNPDSGQNWHHIVDNGHNKKNRKKVSLKIRLLTNTTGKNYDASNLPISATCKDEQPKHCNKIKKYKHRTRQEREAAKDPNSEWVLLSNPQVPNAFFRDHDPYPRISSLHQTTLKSLSYSSYQDTLKEGHGQHTFQNPTEFLCRLKPCKHLQDSREQTYLHQPSKLLVLPTPPRYPSPVGHHCYPTPATTPDLNTCSASSYPSSRNCFERGSSLSPCPPAPPHWLEDCLPIYEEADSSYLSNHSPSVASSTSSAGVNPLNHLCQAVAIDSHSSSSLVRCPNIWQSREEASEVSPADDRSCYDDADNSSRERAATCSPYNSPYPSPCPSDPVGMEDEDSLHCLSAIVADRPRLPVPRACCSNTRDTGLTTTGTLRHAGASRVTFAVPGGVRCSRRKQRTPKKGIRSASLALDVVTESPYWTQKKTCCGIVNLGKNRELLLRAGQYKPCSGGHHDATCSAALQRLSSDTRVASSVEETVSNISENSSDSFEMMARDMAFLQTRSTSPPTLFMASPADSTCNGTNVNSAAPALLCSDRINIRTSLSVWAQSTPQSCLQQHHRSRPSTDNLHTTEDDLMMDDYQVVGNVYHNWNRYYDGTEKQRLEQDTMAESNRSDMTYFKEVIERQCPAVSVSKVDALGALDLTKDTGGWGRGPPGAVN